MSEFSIGDKRAPITVTLQDWRETTDLLVKMGLSELAIRRLMLALDDLSTVKELFGESGVVLEFSINLDIPDVLRQARRACGNADQE